MNLRESRAGVCMGGVVRRKEKEENDVIVFQFQKIKKKQILKSDQCDQFAFELRLDST